MADNELSERRVYVLPKEQLDRIRAYQANSGLTSEVEAVRRLLDVALQLRDTIEDLLNKLRSKFTDEKDLRVLARDLIGHALVSAVAIKENQLEFDFAGGIRGAIDGSGKTMLSRFEDHWETFPKPRPTAKSPSSGWDTRPSNDLDDEIPF